MGIATARVDTDGVCSVDGFIHGRFKDSYEALIMAAMEWGEQRNAVRFTARLSVEDEEKRVEFEGLGFRYGAEDGVFAVDGRDVPAVAMILN